MSSDEPPTELVIENGQCVGCAICVDVCPHAALTIGTNELQPVWLADRCTACADCVRECPTAAIRLNFEMVASAA